MEEWLNFSKRDYETWMNANGSLEQCLGENRDQEISYDEILRYKKELREKLGSDGYKGTFADADFNWKHKQDRIKVRLPTVELKDLSMRALEREKMRLAFCIFSNRNHLYYSPTFKL